MPTSSRNRFLKDFPAALHEGVGAVFVGAGVSKAAGYPTWAELLKDIGEELGVRSSDIQDLAALAQWHISESGAATGVRNVIRQEIGKDRPVPPTLEVLARLPVRQIWTTNYDRLVERAFAVINRPVDVVSGAADLSLRARPGAARLYKMHGSVDRMDDIVISTDDYELYRSKRGAFLPLLQAHLSSMSVLFIGLSLTDPNVRHVLSLIRESFTEAPPEHFAIVKPPSLADCSSEDEFRARTAQHKHWAKDLRRYGLRTIEVEHYDEIPELMRQVERRVAAMRVVRNGDGALEDVGGNRTGGEKTPALPVGLRAGRFGPTRYVDVPLARQDGSSAIVSVGMGPTMSADAAPEASDFFQSHGLEIWRSSLPYRA